MNKVLTISIAAYNVADYLPSALDSLVGSKAIDKIEVIVVNDGSKDKTLSVAEEYQKMYPQSIRIINKQNGGYGSTINASLEHATGKYFKLLDGDDWFDTDNIAEYISFLESNSTDMVFTQFTECYEPDFANKKLVEQKYKYGEIFYASTVSEYNMHAMAVKTDLIKKSISITEHCFYTDVEFFLKCLINCKTCISIPLNIYCYRLGRDGQSISLPSVMKHYDEHEFVCKECVEMVETYPNLIGLRMPIYRMVARNMNYLLLLPTGKANHQKMKSFRYFVKNKCPTAKKEFSFSNKIVNAFPFLYSIFSRMIRAHNKL